MLCCVVVQWCSVVCLMFNVLQCCDMTCMSRHWKQPVLSFELLGVKWDPTSSVRSLDVRRVEDNAAKGGRAARLEAQKTSSAQWLSSHNRTPTTPQPLP